MNISSIRTTSAIVMASLLIVMVGCGRNRDGEHLGYDDEAMNITEITDAESGMALTGSPFDETKTRATDVEISPIYFGYDSFQLPPGEIAKIQQAAALMEQNANLVLIIEGHCDDRGSNEYNLSLGEQRALAVRNYIVTLGIDPGRIQSRSFGEESPAVIGSGEDVWRLNRRGEFAFYR